MAYSNTKENMANSVSEQLLMRTTISITS